MKPSIAYILKIDDPISTEYAKAAADSCEKVGLKWEYFDGYTTKDKEFWKKVPIKFTKLPRISGPGACCTAGHIHIWTKIAEGNECAVILEHDALMLHSIDINIPDNMMVVLGYKVTDPENYKHEEAGAPVKIEPRKKHGGAHAYAITPKTAQALVQHIKDYGVGRMIDNSHFLRGGSTNLGHIPLGIIDPIAAIGWLRKSTIWPKAAVDNYEPLLPSFKEHYKSKNNLGLKKP